MTTAACSWNLVSLERAFSENTTDFTLPVAANLGLHQTYVVRTAAFTKLGHGPFTQPLVFSMDPANMVMMEIVMMIVIITASLQVDTLVNPHLPDMDLDQLTSQTWFIAFIGSVVFVLVLLFILVMMMMIMILVMMMLM